MKQKRILSWVIVFVMIFTILLPIKKVYALSSYVIGGQTSNGSLRVTIDGNGGINVEKYNGSSFQQQYYAPSGAVLNVDGQLYTLGEYYYIEDRQIKATIKTQMADGNSVTTVWDAGSIEVTQKVTLPSINSQYIKLDWSFNNMSGSSINNIHFLRGEDTYLNGGDNGAGFWDASTHTIGVTKTDNGVTQRLGMQGITTPNSYTSQEYDLVANEVCGGETLSNTIDDNVNTDNGYALEWNTSSLAANSIWKVSAIESFIASSITASADNKTTAGDPVTLTFNVTNSSNSSQDVTYSISNPDGWRAQLQKESDTIASYATNSLSVVVTPSGSINNGVYEILLNISSDGVETQAVGTVAVNITQAINSVSVNPETVSVVQGQTKQLGATVNAVGGAAQAVTWSSSDTNNKVTVDSNGLVTVASDATPGDYTITATSTVDTSKAGTATITVTAAPVAPAVNSVTVNPTTASVVQGQTKQLESTVNAVGGAAQAVTWSSSDTSRKVTVDEAGLVTVASDATPGDYTITATSTVDTSKTGTATITVMTSAAVTYTLNYTAEAGGTIEGDSAQIVDEGSDGTTVTAVPDTGYHFVNWSDGKANASRMDTNVHEDMNVSAEFEMDLPNNTDITTPAAVRISGNQKVDNTLEAQLIDENGLSVTTSSAVTYKWYRISGNDVDNGTLVGEGSTYKLISSDIGKYIKLVVSYIDKTFEKITSKISGNSSSSSSGSSGHSSSSKTSSSSSTEKITVKVTDGKSDTSVSQTIIERTTSSDGTKKDTVTYTLDKAKETIAALASSGKDTARIVAVDGDTSVSETRVNIPNDTLNVLSSGNVNLQIETGSAMVSLPKESIQGLVQNGELNGDLYFRLVPIKDQTKQTAIKETANQQAVIRAISGNNGVQVLGTPMTIETNMSQRAVEIVLPLKGINLPNDPTERQAFLSDLGVFIEHSDGEKVLEKGQVVEYAAGVFGIKFTVNKFSDFTIVKLNKSNQTGWKKDNGYWYFFNNTGTMITGWYKSESGDWVYDGKDTVGQWFHLGIDGKMDTGWFKDSDGTWYFLCDGENYGALGYMETGWKFIDGKWYFLKSNGAMATGWAYVDGNWYYLYTDGSMASNTAIDGYRLDTNGAWINN
ncbi:Ig-like domain-containing protein [Clostridium sp. YIM B02500]|uniref:COG1470 family protein n=1 Tax=Clostridium sp. YIM B02500 TaxID=2910681 RepID=UPI001EED735F|nr:Ig-like domain-containing protein [Clostridium sp. YIM B02500]